jgi:hypothetical protein
MSITIQSVCQRWSDPNFRPLFKGRLIDDSGCCCAQGDILRLSGTTDDELRSMSQINADRKVAKVLGISTLQSVLLRQINDSRPGCPQAVLDDVKKILGPHANLIIALGVHLDGMSIAAWAAACDAAWAAAGTAVWNAAWNAAGAAAWDAAKAAVWNAAGVAAGATAGAAACELCGWSHLATDPFFLPLLGIADPVAWVEKIDPQANRDREAFIASQKES